ncbi:pyruvate dehydrogenase [Snodgrassella communis]|uniref:thiamine pyrophosphate-dependent enzyme n=1 Tax=Snodgrassella communis TaxID=2946699 RepID=UPI000C1DDC3A|nr:thiamine pyrophosphate-dependent enzyme [Snodgrassella communis]PIT21595.1 pyruvate dehydrogenase [Snodgrassella communis]
MSKTKTVSEVLIDVLTTAGVSNCYGIIGDTLNFVGKAIEKSSINWVHTRHEEAAAFAAGAEAMITNKLTACAGSCGPGSLHLINGLYESNRNNAPVIVIASQLAATSMGTGFPQEVDFLKVYQDTSVFCQMVTQPQEAQRIFTQAAQAAINKRGVAVVILPSDISKMEVVEQPIKIWHPQPVTRPNDSEIEELVTAINQGNRITIYAGYGSKDAHNEVIALAEKLKAPVVHTSRAKDSIAWENPYQVGMTGMFGTKAGYEAVKNCDTLLLLGCSFAWTEFYPENANIIQIDHDATQLGLRHPINLGLVGDIKTTLQTVLPKIQPRSDSNFLEHHTALFTKIMDKYEAHATPDDKHPIHPQQLIELIDKHADDNALITADVGTPMLWGSRYLTMNGKRRFLTSLKHSTMANGMPQAYGLQKAFPARQVISLSGDGGLAMLMGDLLTAKQENLPIKIVVFNNSSLNFVEQEQKGEGLVEVFVDLKNGDFKTIAEGCGFSAQSVSKSSELEAAVQTFLAHKGPALLDVVISDKELIMPPAISYENVKNMVWYGSKAIFEGKGKDVIDMIKNNI